jgi:hypothetical protein
MKATINALTKHRKAILSCAIIVVLSFVARGQFDERGQWQNGVDEPWFFTRTDRYATGEATAAQRRWHQIRVDNEGSASHEWAGDYSRGLGEVHDVYLRWSPESGFTYFLVYTCLPEVTNLDYGRVSVSPNLIQMISERPSGRSILPRNFLPVRWGNRHYLVSEENLAAFCDYTAGLGVFNDIEVGREIGATEFFLKNGDWREAVEGLPQLPPGYEHFNRRPIEAAITSVRPRFFRRMRDSVGGFYRNLIIPVTINAGRAQGVRRGLVLYMENEGAVRVIQVGRNSSRGEIVRGIEEEPISVTVGSRLSTRHPLLTRSYDQ